MLWCCHFLPKYPFLPCPSSLFPYALSAGISAHTVLVLKYLKQESQSHEVLLYDITQILQDQSRIPVADLPRPEFGTITGPCCSFHSSQIFYRCSDLSDPGSIYRAVINRDLFSGSIEIFFDQLSSVAIPGVDKYRYETIKEICRDRDEPIADPNPNPNPNPKASSSGCRYRP